MSETKGQYKVTIERGADTWTGHCNAFEYRTPFVATDDAGRAIADQPGHLSMSLTGPLEWASGAVPAVPEAAL
jgi:hypothetical protein